MNVAFRPALPKDFDYCERLYFTEMERINRELKLDRDLQVASFRRQWEVMQVRIITFDGADIGWLQSTTRDGTFFLGQLFVEASRQRRGIGTVAMHRLIGEATVSSGHDARGRKDQTPPNGSMSGSASAPPMRTTANSTCDASQTSPSRIGLIRARLNPE